MAAKNFGDQRVDVSGGQYGYVFIETKAKSSHGRWVRPGGYPQIAAIPADAIDWVIAQLQKLKQESTP